MKKLSLSAVFFVFGVIPAFSAPGTNVFPDSGMIGSAAETSALSPPFTGFIWKGIATIKGGKK